MKYVLLFMTIIQVKFFINHFKTIFLPSRYLKEDANKAKSEVREELEKEMEFDSIVAYTTLVLILLTLFLSAYYLLVAIYIGNIIIAALSSLFTIGIFKRLWSSIQSLVEDDIDTGRTSVFDRVRSMVYLSYIGYFIYYLITTW